MTVLKCFQTQIDFLGQMNLAESLVPKLIKKEKEVFESDNKLRDSAKALQIIIDGKSVKSSLSTKPIGPMMPSDDYFHAMWLPIMLEIVPSVKSWLRNIQTLQESKGQKLPLPKETQDRADKLLLKILDCLHVLAGFSESE